MMSPSITRISLFDFDRASVAEKAARANSAKEILADMGIGFVDDSGPKSAGWTTIPGAIWRYFERRANEKQLVSACLRLESLSPHLVDDIGFELSDD